ncbi:hypothetical protein [Pantoea sp. At-9b]|uniref:hypothetical protein n=1 Tax=Pantoea sp. (strain At-9b) TaxID=592316 RepID=UPI0001B3E849|nr:hypothetical protein [Pantoea sp. At-9b]ADU71579.1 hypothetical protein Pat9b_5422 [Pantoea sp. At-9b]
MIPPINIPSGSMPSTSQNTPEVPLPVIDISSSSATLSSNSNKPTSTTLIIDQETLRKEGFEKYAYKDKNKDDEVRYFIGISFSNHKKDQPGQYNKKMRFNNDDFKDLNFSWCIHLSTDNILTNSKISTSKRCLSWLKFSMDSFNWEGTSIDGDYYGMVSKFTCVNFSNIKMSGGTLKNLHITDSDKDLISLADLTNSTIENVTISGSEGSQMMMREVNFSGMRAKNFTWDSVNCTHNVNMTNVTIKGFNFKRKNNLKGVNFGELQQGRITLDADMVSNQENIILNLDQIKAPVDSKSNVITLNPLKDHTDLTEKNIEKNTTEQIVLNLFPSQNMDGNARLLNTLNTCEDPAILTLFAEQIVDMITTKPSLTHAFSHSTTIRYSLINWLCSPRLHHSTLIHDFFSSQLVAICKDAFLPQPLHKEAYHFLDSLDENHLIDYQLAVNQLMGDHENLRHAYYRQQPLSEIKNHVARFFTPKTENLYHIFYHQDSETALYIAEEDFNAMLACKHIPTAFALLKYKPHRQDSVRFIDNKNKELGRILNYFPTLHLLWTLSTINLAPVITKLLDIRSGNKNKFERIQEITHLLILCLHRKTTRAMDLTGYQDQLWLGEVVKKYCSEDAKDADDNKTRIRQREYLVELVEQQLQKKNVSLSPEEQKVTSLFILMKMMVDLSSADYCGNARDSPQPFRQLAKEFLDDLATVWPGFIDTVTAQDWRNRLFPNQTDAFPCTGILADIMREYIPDIAAGSKIAEIVKMHYPL